MMDSNPAVIEVALQRLVTVYIVTGLLFLLLPGTFLESGIWFRLAAGIPWPAFHHLGSKLTGMLRFSAGLALSS